ncbi:MAG: lamin tail domain-containing protein, partial [Candidatus Neomarinimicrobiota bacterium]
WGVQTGMSLERIDPDEKSADRSNWKPSKDVRRATPGSPNSVLVREFDAALDSVFIPKNERPVVIGKPVKISVAVRNAGLQTINSMNIEIRIFSELSVLDTILPVSQALAPGESRTEILSFQPAKGGIFSLLAVVLLEPDGDSSNDSVTCSLTIGYPAQTIVINEFMCQPESGNAEWIELFNRSESSVNLRNWSLKHASSTIYPITDSTIVIQPKSFAVVTAGENTGYEIPSGIPVIVPGSFPALTNSGDSIIVIDAAGQRIDALKYVSAWGVQTGMSLERIDPDEKSSDRSNWKQSKDVRRATPGSPNSILVREFDAALDSVFIPKNEHPVVIGKPVQISIAVRNAGLQTINSMNIEMRIFSELSVLDTILPISQALTPGESRTEILSFQPEKGGMFSLLAVVLLESDGDSSNDSATCSLTIGYPAQSLVINEFMCQPESGNAEWIELFNRSESSVNLRNWSLKHASSTIYPITDSTIVIEPRSFAVVTASENTGYEIPSGIPVIIPGSFPSLTNSGDSIIVIDAAGQRIDALRYVSAWGVQTGMSLERIDKDRESSDRSNWKPSKDVRRATPGRPNSVLIREFDAALDSVFIPKNERPVVIGKPVQISIAVRNAGLQTINSMNIEIRIFSELSVLDTILPILQALTPGESRTEILSFQPAKGGVFSLLAVVLLESDGDSSNDSATCSLPIGYPAQTIVINEFMCQPESGNAEWIELFNRSESSVNLRNWSLKHASSTIYPITDSTIVIQPKSFAVVTAGENTGYEIPPNIPVIVPGSFPSLTNSGDSIIVIDAAGQRIDALRYVSAWGVQTGMSLERIDPDEKSSDRSNWKQSKDVRRATPGRPNSVLIREFDAALDSVFIPKNEHPVVIGKPVQISIAVRNAGLQTINSMNIEIRIFSELSVLDTILPILQALTPGESRTEYLSFQPAKGGVFSLLAVVLLESDGDSSNDSATCSLTIGYLQNCIAINEIMYYPNSGGSEWFEILNRSSFPVDLNRWQFRDGGGKWSPLCDSSQTIEPSGFFVVAATGDFRSDNPEFTGTVVFPSLFPNLNNTSDSLFLRDAANHLIETVHYQSTWGGSGGKSIERRNPDKPAITSDNWGTSVSETGSTPGAANSILKRDRDLALDSVATFFNIGDTLKVFSTTFAVRNCGKFSSESATLTINEYRGHQFTEIARKSIPALSAGECQSVLCTFGPFLSGIHRLTAVVRWNSDTHPANDSLNFTVRIAFPEASLLISEFLAYPAETLTAATSIAEYVEFYNPMNRNVSLEGWKFSDENTGRPVTIGSADSIRAYDFFVVAGDSSIFHFPDLPLEKVSVIDNFPSLNNDEDRIVLFDPTLTPIDSVWFTSLWKIEQNTAMERVFFTNPNNYQNWRSSVSPAGGTPGLPNSVSITSEIAKPGIRAEPNPFSPDGDGRDDEAAFHYRLPFPSAKISLEIFDVAGRLIFKPADHLSTSSEGVVYWNGESRYGAKARTGIYIVKCSAVDSAGKKTVGYVTTVALVRGL